MCENDSFDKQLRRAFGGLALNRMELQMHACTHVHINYRPARAVAYTQPS